ncbi:MAG: methylated-DNA--[protein]-cysteine S-methyltransferase [Clostridiales bacterium]|jgi:methylated-DNA-[protein]-cysteine S-methyltransferase|nr:methylated-DNA--[protein]-cysteine S-methyltransferase [Clostridiales bacterium]
MTVHTAYFSFGGFPFGKIGIGELDGQISRLFFAGNAEFSENAQTPLIKEAARQLDEYFKGTRREFALPLIISDGSSDGSPFSASVLRAMRAIPYGETTSYAALAEAAGSPRAARAAGGICRRNPIAIIVPCHRVVGKNGSLTGFAGGLDAKKHLLELERRNLQLP